MDFTEAPAHPHNQARGTYINLAGVEQPAPAPRFQRSSLDIPSAPSVEGSDTETVLASIGVSADEIEQLKSSGAIPS